MKFLGPQDDFPPVEKANSIGLLAFGGDLSPERLLSAYTHGIFPWYDSSQPILWWSPDPRMVLFPEKLKVSKSMKQVLKKGIFEVTFDQDFEQVIQNCAVAPREGQMGTWITPQMQEAYVELHRLGFAKSVEVWQENELVGGLYGIYLKDIKVFCGESMFAKKSNASKFGFIKLVQKLQQEGVKLIDCQVYTDHLASLGAEEIPRSEFLEYLK
ncbi:leucyl/phenylalanyl-tRNA--protein transferase [Salinimicrobium catena]|uniref:Leucyl/phenylalanyl-tRNA--protein transferase n=1 Tax=Salinimicrobium catena TaxID=390640 RepID=A0A1H5JJ17_9FLAO|nr:leucyl/phenylalanyl-tRNA--protein transferase [Salinimicrobium catena]SDK88080.1 leucyl/phenylalanyl-tRNA--protein transferase [Salinimicrobium catena]SEE52460.1 leucyl/phenylalanyl-tRNA--protein transferase [Salinimicrobium catena]